MSKTMTPLRRLHGITYWVIEDPDAIYEFINTNIRREWEVDLRETGRDPQEELWLRTLSKRGWRMEVVSLEEIRLAAEIMNHVDDKSGYNFAERLAERRQALRREIETFASVIWPLIVRAEDMQLVDGYCRYTTLREMGITETYAYLGTLQTSGLESPAAKLDQLPT